MRSYLRNDVTKSKLMLTNFGLYSVIEKRTLDFLGLQVSG
jgi:hypothetical protein